MSTVVEKNVFVKAVENFEEKRTNPFLVDIGDQKSPIVEAEPIAVVRPQSLSTKFMTKTRPIREVNYTPALRSPYSEREVKTYKPLTAVETNVSSWLFSCTGDV